jgi:hypothetical protein
MRFELGRKMLSEGMWDDIMPSNVRVDPTATTAIHFARFQIYRVIGTFPVKRRGCRAFGSIDDIIYQIYRILWLEIQSNGSLIIVQPHGEVFLDVPMRLLL